MVVGIVVVSLMVVVVSFNVVVVLGSIVVVVSLTVVVGSMVVVVGIVVSTVLVVVVGMVVVVAIDVVVDVDVLVDVLIDVVVDRVVIGSGEVGVVGIFVPLDGILLFGTAVIIPVMLLPIPSKKLTTPPIKSLIVFNIPFFGHVCTEPPKD